MRILETAAGALGGCASGLFLAGAWFPGMVWAGVTVAALALVAVLAVSWLEHRAAQRSSVILEAWEQRLVTMEARAEQIRAEVDTLNRERALNRM